MLFLFTSFTNKFRYYIGNSDLRSKGKERVKKFRSHMGNSSIEKFIFDMGNSSIKKQKGIEDKTGSDRIRQDQT